MELKASSVAFPRDGCFNNAKALSGYDVDL